MRLGVHYHLPAIARDGGVWLPYFFGCFIDSIAPYFSQVILFSHGPTAAESSEVGYRLKAGNVKLVPLGKRFPVYVRLALSPYYKWVFKKHARDVDVMLFRVSTVLLPFVAKYFDRKFLYSVSHSTLGLEKLRQPGYRMLFIKWWTYYYARQELALARTNKLLTNSVELKDYWEAEIGREVELVPSTTLYSSDIRPVSFRPIASKVRLLFVGRVSYLKGIEDIVIALRLLRDEGRDVELAIVGEFGKEGDFESSLRRYIHENALSDHIDFKGFVGGGEMLWDIYRQSDIFVTASRESEGMPRVIWEAMAQSLPVVATGVGAIPRMAPGAIEVVTAKRPESIAAGIARVIDDDDYRSELVREGHAAVGGNTLEKRAEQLVQWVNRNFDVVAGKHS
ncbi:MAG TPA: hypothetical protein DIW43_12500 [Spongiibacteraceae bacterium]|nr:hypothetical protein [Spongiibacteraceae bacterium]HCS28270.1 hypothetical protein [Spongiibacteraceae bacterium]|tara:strand:- start:735 stop:1916 length:1182 start_codon:yes stop_codon:yes gene_type:complete